MAQRVIAFDRELLLQSLQRRLAQEGDRRSPDLQRSREEEGVFELHGCGEALGSFGRRGSNADMSFKLSQHGKFRSVWLQKVDGDVSG